METSKAGDGGGALPAAGGGGGSPAGTAPTGHPFSPKITPPHPVGVEGKGATVAFKCRVTFKGGMSFRGIASLFGGQDGGGTHIGGPDGKDLTLELEGQVIFNGGKADASGFKGQDSGGPHIGEPDVGGEAAQHRPPASQKPDAPQSRAAAEGA